MERKESMGTSAQVQLDEVCERVQEDQNGQEEVLTLAFATALHWERNCRRSPALLECLAQRIKLSALLCGGDYIVCETEHGLTSRQELELMKECLDSFRIVTKVFCPLLGNHDRNSNGVEDPSHLDNLQGSPLFVRYFREKYGDRKDVMVVSPDIGSVARVRAFAQRLNVPIAIVDKRRPKANSSEVMNIIGTVEGKHVILLDDMVDTAGSLCGAAKALMGREGAKSVSACATHGILSGPAIQRLDASCLEELVLLDTIVPPDKLPSCVRYISASDSFAEAISRMHDDTSINTIYDELWKPTYR